MFDGTSTRLAEGWASKTGQGSAFQDANLSLANYKRIRWKATVSELAANAGHLSLVENISRSCAL